MDPIIENPSIQRSVSVRRLSIDENPINSAPKSLASDLGKGIGSKEISLVLCYIFSYIE